MSRPTPAVSPAEEREESRLEQAEAHGEQEPRFFEEALAAMDQTIEHALLSAPESHVSLAGDRAPIDPELEGLAPFQEAEDFAHTHAVLISTQQGDQGRQAPQKKEGRKSRAKEREVASVGVRHGINTR